MNCSWSIVHEHVPFNADELFHELFMSNSWMFMNQKFMNIGFMNILKHLMSSSWMLNSWTIRNEQFMNVKFMKYSWTPYTYYSWNVHEHSQSKI